MSAESIIAEQKPSNLSAMADRWDHEWIKYFRRSPDYFVDNSKIDTDVRARIDAVKGAVSRPVDLLSASNPVWRIWAVAVYPQEIWQRAVADLGCGPGAIGRTMGHVTRHFLGVDFARLPLHVARIISPPTCTYVSRYEIEELAKFYGTRDVVFSRNVFIHQNYEQARQLAAVGAMLLKPGGILAADFFDPSNKDVRDPKQRGISRLAKDDLDQDRPTVGYYFEQHEIQEIARDCGLKVEMIERVPERNWRIVRMRR